MPLLILGYHKIGDHPAGEPSFSYVSVDLFRKQLIWLRTDGWQFLSSTQLLNALDHNADSKSAVITFDDGYTRTLTHALPVLRDLNLPALLFVPTQFVGGRNDFDAGVEPDEPICTWEQLRQLDQSNISVQSHGIGHRWMSELDQSAQFAELAQSKQTIEEQIGHEVHFFSYPYGDEGPDPDHTRTLLQRAGYRGAVLFGGAAMEFATLDRWRMQRLPMGPDVEWRKELSS